MIIQLRSHVSVERVGDTAMFLNSQTQTVYTFPGGLVGDVSGNTLTLSPHTTDNHINELVRHQLIESPSPSVTRRVFLGLTTATVGGGLVAISLPTVVAASSGGADPSTNGYWNWEIPDGTPAQFSVFLLNSEFPELDDVSPFDVTFDVDLGAGIIVTLPTYISSGLVGGQPAKWWGSGFVDDSTRTRMIQLGTHPTPPILSAVGKLAGVKFADLMLEGLFTTWPTVPNLDGFLE